MKPTSLLSVVSLAFVLGACRPDTLRDGETCSQPVACPMDARRHYQACTTDGMTSCRFLASDGTSFECGDCASCSQTLLDVNDWCSGTASMPGQHGAALTLESAEWASQPKRVVVSVTVKNLSTLNLTAQPALFTVVDSNQNVVACEPESGYSRVGCDGTGTLAQGGVAACELEFVTSSPRKLVYSDGAHSAELVLDPSTFTTYVPPAPENTAALCSDGKDNDGNGKIDCDDNESECCNQNPSCPPNTFCWSLPWYRQQHGAATEHSVSACTDGIDNDGDHWIDCDDYDCCALVTCPPSTACGK